jgi:rhomboid protease GluP
MVFKSVLTKNWMTKRDLPGALLITLALVTILLASSFIFLHDIYNSADWMPASKDAIFKHHEYWRLWSALFAHGDLPHIFGNLFLFIPFSYYLSGYFGFSFFPLAGFFLGGVTNFIVLTSMPGHVSLIGASGVVYWMGGAWMTLAYLIDRREKKGRRLLRSIGISMILFLPENYKSDISYSSHFIGFGLGMVSAIAMYSVHRKQYLQAEVIEYVVDEDVDFDWSGEEGNERGFEEP